MTGPNPDTQYPLAEFKQVGFLKNFIVSEHIIVGDYTYYDDPNGVENFEKNVLYHFPFIGDKLIIGKFCAIAREVKFIMNGANHKTSGASTFPFFIFANGWEAATPAAGELPYKGDTVVGHDVWIGHQAIIMPGVNIGDGAIIASESVVTNDVPPYSVVGGNPAVVIKQRFDDQTIKALKQLAWWDWPAAKISQHVKLISGDDIEALLSLAAESIAST